MRISAKARYALAAMADMARQHTNGEAVTVISISEKLGISKFYLEQVFSLLRRGGLVSSVKGAAGGYLLTRAPDRISALDVLMAVEFSLFEDSEATVQDKAPQMGAAMHSLVFRPLDASVREALARASLEDIVNEMERDNQDYMFFI